MEGKGIPTYYREESVLSKVTNDFISSTSLHGYHYLNEPKRHWIERLFWIVVHIVIFWGMLTIILNIWNEYLNTPTFTMMDTTHFPIWKIDFPGIAICENNKISLKEVTKLAHELSIALRNINQSKAPEDILYDLRFLGRLYDFENIQEELGLFLDQMLELKNMTVMELMIKISPKCEDILLQCFWEGHERLCSELFSFRKTMEGFCCAFNYLSEIDHYEKSLSTLVNFPIFVPEKPYVLPYSGFEMGLSVIAFINSSDYFYPLEPHIGLKGMIFNENDFPDKATGGLIEATIPAEFETFIELTSTTLFSENDVRYFEADKRGCWFSDELSSKFNKSYSYSDCIMNCRIDSIAILCNCLPFYLPEKSGIKLCELKDNKCLTKYKDKWFTKKPSIYEPGLEKEIQDSIDCHYCLPTCMETTYYTQNYFAPLLSNPIGNSKGFLDLKETKEINNFAVMNFYYQSDYTTTYKHAVLYYWYELVSNFGSICGLFVGFSFLSAIEFVYFFGIRLLMNLFFEKLGDNKKDFKEREIFYWKELLAKENKF